MFSEGNLHLKKMNLQ